MSLHDEKGGRHAAKEVIHEKGERGIEALPHGWSEPERDCRSRRPGPLNRLKVYPTRQ